MNFWKIQSSLAPFLSVSGDKFFTDDFNRNLFHSSFSTVILVVYDFHGQRIP